MQPPLTSSKGAGHLKRGTDFAEKTICTLCRKRARSGSFFRWGQHGSADTPRRGTPRRGVPRDPAPCSAVSSFFSRVREVRLRLRTKKRRQKPSFFLWWGQQGSADTPEGGPSAGSSARPCALLRGFVVLFPRARGSPAPPHKKKKAKAFLFFVVGTTGLEPVTSCM